MVTQVRFYTVKDGMMDSWVRHFNEKIVPTSAKYGVHVQAAWVNRAQNEFIWVRTFADEQERDAKQAAFREAAQKAGVQLGGNVAKMEVREVEPAFVAAQV
jgi:hypothetical protein